MLTYSMDDRNGDSLYDYLYKCIKNDIMSGKLKAGIKLPSKRNFAKNLGVSVITIENAYSQLMAEGFIYSMEKRGYYVAAIGEIISVPPPPDNDINSGSNSGADKDVDIDLVSNIVNYDKFPFSIWSRLTREVLSEQNEGLLRSAPVKGIEDLRQAISDYLYNFRGMSVSADRIVIGAGTEYLYSIIVQLLGRDKIYAMEDPGYPKVSYVLEGNGVQCIHIPIDSFGMGIGALSDRGADIVHLTPSHHFPTGIVMPIFRRLEFLNWAYEKDGRYLIEDDYDCEFRLQGRPIQTLAGIDTQGRVIYINTFSKTLAPSFRISYMVLPQELIDRYEKMMGYMACTVPNVEQYVLARFIKRGYFERHINRMRVFYRGIRDELLNAIKESRYGSKVNIREENSGLHFLVSIDTDMTDDIIVERATACGLKLACLSDYAYDPEIAGRHIIIVNYSGIGPESIEKAVKLLGDVIDNTNLPR